MLDESTASMLFVAYGFGALSRTNSIKREAMASKLKMVTLKILERDEQV